MNLLIITQKVDKNDPILGFFHRWLLEFAKNVDKLTVICLYEGEHNLPKNVKVLSLGKEKYFSERCHHSTSSVEQRSFLARLAKVRPLSRQNFHKGRDFIYLGSEELENKKCSGSATSEASTQSTKVVPCASSEGATFVKITPQKSLLKEKVFSKIIYIWRFYKYIYQERKNYDSVFVHMNQIYIILGGLFWIALGKKISLWYAHGGVSFSLRIAEKLTNNIFTSTQSGFRLKSKKLNVIGQGIDTDFFKPNQNFNLEQRSFLARIKNGMKTKVGPLSQQKTDLCVHLKYGHEQRSFLARLAKKQRSFLARLAKVRPLSRQNFQKSRDFIYLGSEDLENKKCSGSVPCASSEETKVVPCASSEGATFVKTTTPKSLLQEKIFFKIISVGRISPVKDYETTIEAIEILQKRGIKIELNIIGGVGMSSQEDYLKQLNTLVANKGLSNIIKFSGPMANSDILGFLQESDLYINTSHTGSLDKTVLEAMAVGLPILTCNEALKEVLGKYTDQLMFPKKDPESLADKIEGVIKINNSERITLGQSLRQIVTSDHTLSGFIKKIIGKLK